jgi:hypothetical protein
MNGLRPGEVIPITAYRGNRKMEFHVKLGVAGQSGADESARNQAPEGSAVHAALYRVFQGGN